MLPLNPAQVQALQAIQRRRHIALLAQSLSAAFPDVAGRLGERYPLLIDLGVQRGSAFGLSYLLCLARYIACWCVLGAEFENRPGFGWATSLLGSHERTQGSKVFQLCRRVREELARLARQSPAPAGLMSAAAFDQAIATLDAQLKHRGALAALLPSDALQLGEACDIDAIELRQVEPAATALYRLEQEQWQRGSSAAERGALRLQAASAGPAPGLPPQLFVLAPADAKGALLRIRTAAQQRCDPDVHPLVSINGPSGAFDWRGRLAEQILLPLAAPPAAPLPADALQPRIGAEGPATTTLLGFAGCGMRDDGVAIGAPSTQIVVRSAEQHLLVWQRTPGPAVVLPDATAQPGRTRVHVERDGTALDASRWQLGFDDLEQRLQQALARIASAWERESGVAQPRLEAEPKLLCGQTAVTWGWAEASEGLAAAPVFRIAGQIDVVACQLDLRLSGLMQLRGATSRIELVCKAGASLASQFERTLADADITTALAGAKTAWRLPFVLTTQALAADSACTVDPASSATGALVGRCGLRPRPDGSGLQWFYQLELEAVAVVLLWQDPLLGQQEMLRPLLPALPLLDWSLG